MLYSFGAYVFRIIGDADLIARVSVRLQPYLLQEETTSLATLYLKTNTCLSHEISTTEGWATQFGEHSIQIIYGEADRTRFVIEADLERKSIAICVSPSSKDYIYIGIQYAILLVLAGQCIGLHGVTLICKGEVIVLSAPSGTGKTTLASLLHQYCNAAIVNGDFALLSIHSEHGVLFEPTPFCGTSKRSLNLRLPITKIVFLEQALENSCRRLPIREALVHLMSNVFLPEWDLEMKNAIQDCVIQVVESIPMYMFSFEPTLQAAEMFCSSVTK